jgi:Uma2 family endonuclease
MAVTEEVKTIVRLLMRRPITEALALEIERTEGFEHLEIENGEWIGFDEESFMGGEQYGWIESLIIALLTTWVLQSKAGRIYSGDTDFVLEGTPNHIQLKRRPDVAFVRSEKIRPSEGYIYGAPDLAVEIISPTERPGGIRKKLHEYLSHGVKQVWQIYPENREIVVYLPDETSKTYRPGDTIPGGDLLPGFTLDVAQVFEQN